MAIPKTKRLQHVRRVSLEPQPADELPWHDGPRHAGHALDFGICLPETLDERLQSSAVMLQRAGNDVQLVTRPECSAPVPKDLPVPPSTPSIISAPAYGFLTKLLSTANR